MSDDTLYIVTALDDRRIPGHWYETMAIASGLSAS